MTEPIKPPKPEFTETSVGRIVDAELDERLHALKAAARRGRSVEDVAMYVGIGQAALYGVGEFLMQIGVVPRYTGVPYMTIALFLGCVLPKTVGRATAGRIWTVLADTFASRFGKKP